MYKVSRPKYAQHANENRLVKLFCKGSCRCMRWAEMNTDYPDAEVLRKSQMGDITATCLKCRRIALDPYNWIFPRSGTTSGSKRHTPADGNQPEDTDQLPDETGFARVREGALRANNPVNISISTLGTSELVDAIEQLCAGDSVAKILQWLREHRDEYFYQWNQELIALSVRVQERIKANLADLTDKILRTIVSPATKKYYETAISMNLTAARASFDKNSLQLTSARRILDFVYDCIEKRVLAWTEVQNKRGFWCENENWDLMLLAKGGRYSSLVNYQEQWTELIGTRPCESDHAEQQKTASDLDRMVDEVLQFKESRRVLGVVVDHACAQLAEHRIADKAIGVPSVAAGHDLHALLTVAEDLRKVELHQTVWRLKQLGRHIPTRQLCALLTGNLDSAWPATFAAARRGLHSPRQDRN